MLIALATSFVNAPLALSILLHISAVNVADGASYITADMCKSMLRARGALTNDVAKAINILESSDKYSWMDQKDAYKLIYDKVNLVTTKYTAYGFRNLLSISCVVPKSISSILGCYKIYFIIYKFICIFLVHQRIFIRTFKDIDSLGYIAE